MKNAGKMVGPLPDGSGIVHQVKGHVKFGQSKACTPTGAGKTSNNMVSANSNLKRYAGRGR